MTPLQRRVLLALAEHGPLTRTEIARRVGTTRAQASRAVKTLNADLLVQTLTDVAPGIYPVGLTDAGQRRAQELTQ